MNNHEQECLDSTLKVNGHLNKSVQFWVIKIKGQTLSNKSMKMDDRMSVESKFNIKISVNRKARKYFRKIFS